MNVLSLFDGISCGQIALNRAKIKYKNYFSSEIDKNAISVTQHNYPKTIQLGDVTKINFKSLPKIHLLIGGSPCQGFSISGKQLAFNDSRSKLFFEFVRALKELKPKYFLLENVKMKKEYENIISDFLGVTPIQINSALVSAQNRKRLYWANIPNITQPKNKNIFLRDILEKNITDDIFFISDKYWKGTNIENYISQSEKPVALTERRTEEAKIIRKEYQIKDGKDFCPRRGKELVVRKDGKMNCLTSTYSIKEHSLIDENGFYRKLTPVECERLQTLPDNYTSILSNSQRYRSLGNGWTVDVIVHILKNI
jgi:DNA (cytosine-5)-methyltransferase 3A